MMKKKSFLALMNYLVIPEEMLADKYHVFEKKTVLRFLKTAVCLGTALFLVKLVSQVLY